MNIFGQEGAFWATVLIAAAIKWMFSVYKTRKTQLASFAAAVFTPWLLTDAILDWMTWDPDTYLLPTAGLLAWTGEQLVKAISSLDVEKLLLKIAGLKK